MNTIHGTYTISVSNNTIYTTLSGSFNEFGVKAWACGMKKAIKAFNGEQFSMLVDELKAEGATPEALAEGEKYNQWLNQQKIKAKAVVYPSEMLRDIDVKNLPARAKQPIKLFLDLDEARNWLNQQ